MSQFQPNAAPNRSFIEKINSKFSGLSVSGSLSSSPEHDGSSEDQTLIHKAFVKFFDSNNEPYPDWLGVKPSQNMRQHSEGYVTGGIHNSRSSMDYQNSQYQPVRASYNSSHRQELRDHDGGDIARVSSLPVAGPQGGYTRRTNSRLQEMYQKSRQKAPMDSSNSAISQPSLGGRNNSTSQMRRDRVLNGGSQLGEPRANWGR